MLGLIPDGAVCRLVGQPAHLGAAGARAPAEPCSYGTPAAVCCGEPEARPLNGVGRPPCGIGPLRPADQGTIPAALAPASPGLNNRPGDEGVPMTQSAHDEARDEVVGQDVLDQQDHEDVDGRDPPPARDTTMDRLDEPT